MSRSKNIGTAAETAVVNAARRFGFPQADRLPLSGALDRGDIGLCPGVIVEVKAGQQTRSPSDTLIEAWMIETERERLNAGATVGLLVTQRHGVGHKNAHRWWAWWRLGDLYYLHGPHERPYDAPVCMYLEDVLYVLHGAGYGTPTTPQETP
jgi:hypothetical protein